MQSADPPKLSSMAKKASTSINRSQGKRIADLSIKRWVEGKRCLRSWSLPIIIWGRSGFSHYFADEHLQLLGDHGTWLSCKFSQLNPFQQCDSRLERWIMLSPTFSDPEIERNGEQKTLQNLFPERIKLVRLQFFWAVRRLLASGQNIMSLGFTKTASKTMAWSVYRLGIHLKESKLAN